MNEQIKVEIKRLQSEIAESSHALALLANDYEEKRQVQQQKLSSASVQLAGLVSIMERQP